ncbi:glycosyltransferase family 4 protein [Candidatus Viridilinea mediisalina]|uniref:Glycosyl transferase family 1 n=1 Tax=Candidatus Viridilinea mediisalina TaxID=2024553 RepID=A0A2A6RIK7_9CHLR|nr:glycosyltransferase family 4 protein [Candidatus Viridilinea mediisalina]PDW02715.1 glycosyl transferase family 1 [Candidatus Viridilinea mediisalina]
MTALRIAFLDSWLQQVAEGSGTAAAIGGLGQSLQRAGHKVTRLAPFKPWPQTLTVRRLLFNLYVPALLRRLPYDLVVGFDLDGFLLSGRPLADPYVCSIKGVIAEELRHERGLVRYQLWALAQLERHNARNAARVITTSTYCQHMLQQHYGVAAHKVALVPEGIDLPAWQQLLQQSPAPTHDSQIILCVARQYPRKHISDLIHAFALLHPRLPHARLVIVGDGPEHQHLRQRVAHLQLNSVVTLTGALPNNAAVAAWYRRASIFCLPSVQEGFGIVFLEAMAAGLPIVATTAAAVPEVVPHGLVGELVPPGDSVALASSLAALLCNPARRRELGAAGQHHVMQYDWPVVAQRFLRATRTVNHKASVRSL